MIKIPKYCEAIYIVSGINYKKKNPLNCFYQPVAWILWLYIYVEHVAEWLRHWTRDQEVWGSIPKVPHSSQGDETVTEWVPIPGCNKSKVFWTGDIWTINIHIFIYCIDIISLKFWILIMQSIKWWHSSMKSTKRNA